MKVKTKIRLRKVRKDKLVRVFTLIEMVIVISIMAIILTIAVVKLARPPASVMIEDAAQSLRLLMITGGMRTAAKGNKTYLLYDGEKRKFRVAGDKNTGDENNNSIENRYLTYKLPDDIELVNDSEDENTDTDENEEKHDASLPKMPDYSMTDTPAESGSGDARVVYTFLSSGSGFGPDIKLKMFGHKRTISCSQLTGVVRVREPEGDEVNK